jgi:hypothetical protein
MRRCRPVLLLFLGVFVAMAFVPWHAASGPVEGQVTFAHRPVAGARVRWQGQTAFVLTDVAGRFRLPGLPRSGRRVTASRDGYRTAAVEFTGRPLELRLESLPADDNDGYAWLGAHPDPRLPTNCGNCHDEIYREWQQSAHGRSARNTKFLQLFADPDGKSPPGWDLSREHPLGMAVCATCHTPTLDDGDPRGAVGSAADGIHCDFCHKVADVPTDKLGVRFGRDGMTLLRPKNGDQLFYGPLEDAVRPGESFGHLPLYRESRYCASCHEGIVFGVHVYGTYSEWLESPAKARGVQCQGCHMTPTGRLTNIAPGHGGIARNPATLASHGFPGGEPEMLRRCLQADVQCRREAGRLHVDVTLRAEQVGHRVPTGYIDRHLLLVVQAFDRRGLALPLSAGPVLGAPAGDLAGRPGWLYANLLVGEKRTAPLPFWVAGSEVHDTRLTPGQPDRRSFLFPPNAAKIEVRLLYRRFWQSVAVARGWTDNDLVVLNRRIEP